MNTEVKAEVKAEDNKKETPRRALWLSLACAGLLVVNAAVSYAIVRLNPPVMVAFNMKQTVDAFFDSAGQKTLTEEQMQALSGRFNAAMEASLQTWQREHRAVILVSPAVVQGAPDITRDIQQDISRRMRGNP